VRVHACARTHRDTDGNNMIDFKEFSVHLKELGLQAEPSELRGLFSDLDKDSSGNLDLDEVRRALRRCQDSAAASVAASDDLMSEVASFAKRARAAQKAAQVAHLAL
jgi:Ca2+-binding EF-hand superfamily protein